MRAALVFIFLLLWAPAALACGPYTVALFDHGLLYTRQPDGKWGGLDKDVVDEVARRTGCRFKLVLESRVRIWSMIESDTLDMTVSGIATPAREAHARFLPYAASHSIVVLNKEVAPHINSTTAFMDEGSYKLGVVRGYTFGNGLAPWVGKLRAAGRVHDASDMTALVNLLNIGRVSAILVPQVSWLAAVHAGAQPGRRIGNWGQRDGFVAGLVVSKARVPEAQARKMEQALKAMHSDGTLEAIFRRYMDAAQAASLVQF